MVVYSGNSVQRQRGAALLVSLLLLLGLTVVGIASMRETVTQQRVINAVMEDDAAFQAAEFALRAGEQFVLDQSGTGQRLLSGQASADVYIYDKAELGIEWWLDRYSTEWDSGPAVTTYPQVSSSQRQPTYVIEVLGEDVGNGSPQVGNKGEDTGVVNYRITARGFGVNENYYTVLQSTVGVQY